jgi:virginiamycin B lyase
MRIASPRLRDTFASVPRLGGVRRGVLGVLAGLVAAVGCGSAASAASAAPPQIYWANSGGDLIEAANLDGTNVVQRFITGAIESGEGAVDGPEGVAVDGQHIYWTNFSSGTIGEANLNGTDVNGSLITGASDPVGIAVDGQHIYWTNETSGTIGEANLNGTDVNQSFITAANGPFGVAVDGQRIYWTNLGSNTIGEANLDGTDVDQSFITAANGPEGVAVDGQRIYWTNGGSNTIGEANLDGTDVDQSFITGAEAPDGLAVDAQQIYWANQFGGSTGASIGQANLDGTDVNESFVPGADAAGFAVSVPVAAVNPSSPPAFATTPQGTVAAPQTLTLSNRGEQDLLLTGLSFTGADPGDFWVGADTCLGSIDPGSGCQLEVFFAPQGQGARSATLQIQSTDDANSPLQVPLSGAGGRLQGPPGAHHGSRGEIELVSCSIVKVRVGHRIANATRCTARPVSGGVGFTTVRRPAVRASVLRDGILYASGASVSIGSGRSELLLTDRRQLRHGRYTLVLRHRSGARWVPSSQAVTISEAR